MTTKAQEIIVPKSYGIFRTIFLNVGQGDSTLLVIPDGNSYQYMLIDCNIDRNPYEINLEKMLKDLLGNEKLDFFVNTHPHKDHLEGIKEVYDNVGIKEIWHSGHEPKGSHKEYFKEFKKIMNDFEDNHIYSMIASNDENKLDGSSYKIGDIDFHILSPAKYVCDDIEDEDADTHYRRIHEQCAVIKFSYGSDTKSVLMTGDSDLCAWKDHITDYHSEDLESIVLHASHHGSRTFFKNSEDDTEKYTDHIKLIKPQYIVVSAPKQKDSEHGHPHDDAMKIYKEYVEKENLIHLGENQECVIVDIDLEGNIEIRTDKELVQKYGFKNEEDSDESKNNLYKSIIGIQTTKLDDKPMGES